MATNPADRRARDACDRRPPAAVRWPVALHRVVRATLLAVTLPLALMVSAQVPTTSATPMVPKTGPARVDRVEVELVADVTRVMPGRPFRLGLRLAHDPHWHTYWRNPGDSGLPTQFDPQGPAGTRFDDIDWPAPRRVAVGPLANYGYEGETVLSRQVTLAPTFDARVARFEVLAQWLVCKDVCIPGEAALALDLPIAAAPVSAPEPTAGLFAASLADSPARDRPLSAGWWQRGDEAALVLPASVAPVRAEFFPYFKGIVTPAAAQRLVQADGGRQLRLATMAAPLLSMPAAGLLVVDGRSVEVRLEQVAAVSAPGELLAVCDGRIIAAAAAWIGGRLGSVEPRARTLRRPA